MLVHRSHPSRDSVAQIIWRLRMVRKTSDINAALNVAIFAQRRMSERAEKARANLAKLGYNLAAD